MQDTEPSGNITVGELATHRPRAIKVLQQHNIDFCCGGKRPLARVCADAGVAVATLLGEIEAEEARDTSQVVDWSVEPLAKLVDYITTRFHAPLPSDLAHLEALATKVKTVHGAKDPRLVDVAEKLAALRAELLPHVEKEDRILFPRIKGGGGPGLEAPIRVMLMDHDDAGALLHALRELTSDYVAPEGACRSWRALWDGLARFDAELKEHIHLENNVLFPRALTTHGLAATG